MAYFANSTEGSCFDAQCEICKYGEDPCPIAFVQIEYNYDAANNEVATNILEHLIKSDGRCMMFEMCKKEFYDAGEKQIELDI